MNCLNPGGGCCGEPRSRHGTPAWVTRVKLRLKKKKKEVFLLPDRHLSIRTHFLDEKGIPKSGCKGFLLLTFHGVQTNSQEKVWDHSTYKADHYLDHKLNR